MSATTTPLLSAVDIETHALDLTESTWSRINKLDQDEYLAVAKRCIVKGIELASAKLLAENAALRERLAVLEGHGVVTEHRMEGIEARVRTAVANVSKPFETMDEKRAAVKELNEAVNEMRMAKQLFAPTPSDASLRAAAQVAADALQVVQHRRGPFHRDMEAVRALAALAEQGVIPTTKP
jgi:hypothetical protein